MDRHDLRSIVNDEIGVTVAFWTSIPKDILAFIVGFLSLVTIFQFISPISFTFFWLLLGCLVFPISMIIQMLCSKNTIQKIKDNKEELVKYGKKFGLQPENDFGDIYYSFLHEMYLNFYRPIYVTIIISFLTLPLTFFCAIAVGFLHFELVSCVIMIIFTIILFYIIQSCLPLFDNLYRFDKSKRFYQLNIFISLIGIMLFLILSFNNLRSPYSMIPNRIALDYYGLISVNLWLAYSIIVVTFQILFALIIIYLSISAQSSGLLREKFLQLNAIRIKLVSETPDIGKLYDEYLIAKIYGVSISRYLQIFTLTKVYFNLTNQEIKDNLPLFRKYFHDKNNENTDVSTIGCLDDLIKKIKGIIEFPSNYYNKIRRKI